MLRTISGKLHASGSSNIDAVAYPLLIDTLYFVIDGIYALTSSFCTCADTLHDRTALANQVEHLRLL